jgi:hypothetical protein
LNHIYGDSIKPQRLAAKPLILLPLSEERRTWPGFSLLRPVAIDPATDISAHRESRDRNDCETCLKRRIYADFPASAIVLPQLPKSRQIGNNLRLTEQVGRQNLYGTNLSDR